MIGRPFDLVIFDCDGVLVDSEPIAHRLFVEALADIGVTLTFEESVERFMGRSAASCLAVIEELLGGQVPPDFPSTVERRTFAAFERELQPVPGIAEALDGMDVPTCVASSGSHRKMETTLGITGLLPRFAGRLFSATEVDRPKPFPDLFLHAASRLGVPAARCAVVEDSPVGIEAARAAGMTALGFEGLRGPEPLRRAGAAVVFDDMRHLPALVTSSPRRADGNESG